MVVILVWLVIAIVIVLLSSLYHGSSMKNSFVIGAIVKYNNLISKRTSVRFSFIFFLMILNNGQGRLYNIVNNMVTWFDLKIFFKYALNTQWGNLKKHSMNLAMHNRVLLDHSIEFLAHPRRLIIFTHFYLIS